MKEIWKKVKGFESSYEVSNLGKVKSFKIDKVNGMILKPSINKWGYYNVILYAQQKPKSKLVHRVVIETFIENKKNKPYANHINGIKLDNRVENLEWCTNQENIDHAVKMGLYRKGETNTSSKLTRKEVLEIRLFPNDVKLKFIAEKYGVSASTISAIRNRLTWKHI
jgi:sRNA-binding regulator protein Hfq